MSTPERFTGQPAEVTTASEQDRKGLPDAGGSGRLAGTDRADLARLEATINHGLQTFVEVGAALAEIRDRRLYREEHGTFEVYCEARWKMSRRQAYRLIDAADVVENVSNWSHPTPASEAVARPLTGLPPAQQREAWSLAVEEKGGLQPTAKDVERAVERVVPSAPPGYDVAEARKLAAADPHPENGNRLAVHHSSETGEWYTPAHIIAAVVATLGGIDLDPCSNPGVPAVPAARHFTYLDDGLVQPWAGRVYMNPPYGRAIGDWTTKLRESFEAGEVAAAVALVPARTDTAWMHDLRDYPRCFVRGRIAFSGHDTAAPFPSCAVYLGPDPERFAEAFAELGDTFVRMEAA